MTRNSLQGATDKKVGFDQVAVHVHKQVLGSNPAVRKGLPVELSWQPAASLHFTVDDYENQQRENDDTNKPQRLTAAQREELLRRNGHSRSSFLRTQREIYKIQKEAQKARLQEARQNKRNKKKPYNFLFRSFSKLQSSKKI